MPICCDDEMIIKQKCLANKTMPLLEDHNAVNELTSILNCNLCYLKLYYV